MSQHPDASFPGAGPGGARILLVDDERSNLRFLHDVLEPQGFGTIVEHTDAGEAAARLGEIRPDLVILDLMMPGVDGFQFMEIFRNWIPRGDYVPVLVATGDPAVGTRRRALTAGASDFLTKPLSPAEVRLRVRNLLRTRFLHAQLRDHNATLEERVHERTRELYHAHQEALDRLAQAAEFRDDDTGRHTERVGRLSARLAQLIGFPDDQVALLGRAAPLHDIGKIGIPDSILLKEGRLTEAEQTLMRTHTTMGAQILSGSQYPLLRLAEEIALCHHERWDGAGYPAGLEGEQIPPLSRIVAVADVFDSLTHERPYKRAWTAAEALATIRGDSGRHFEPRVVEALLAVVPAEDAAQESGAGEAALERSSARMRPSPERELELLLQERRSLDERIRRLDRATGRGVRLAGAGAGAGGAA